MHGCFPKHSRMGTTRMKQDKDTEQEGEKSEYGRKEVQRARKKMSRQPITT